MYTCFPHPWDDLNTVIVENNGGSLANLVKGRLFAKSWCAKWMRGVIYGLQVLKCLNYSCQKSLFCSFIKILSLQFYLLYSWCVRKHRENGQWEGVTSPSKKLCLQIPNKRPLIELSMYSGCNYLTVMIQLGLNKWGKRLLMNNTQHPTLRLYCAWHTTSSGALWEDEEWLHNCAVTMHWEQLLTLSHLWHTRTHTHTHTHLHSWIPWSCHKTIILPTHTSHCGMTEIDKEYRCIYHSWAVTKIVH